MDQPTDTRVCDLLSNEGRTVKQTRRLLRLHIEDDRNQAQIARSLGMTFEGCTIALYHYARYLEGVLARRDG